MACSTSCFLAVGLLVAMLFTMLTPEKLTLEKEYLQLLNEEQRLKYYKVRKERAGICLSGFGIGLIIAFLVVWYMKKSIFTSVCLVGGIVFVFSYFYYVFYPKSMYMVTELDDKEDRVAWLKIYKHMQKMYHLGFVLGVVGAMILCYGIFKK